MTDPSPDAAQPPVPHRPMPTLGRGVHWPDIMAKIEADRRDKPAPAGALDHARRQLGIEDAAKEAAQFADEALELAELALPAANEALAAVGGESGNAPSTPSLVWVEFLARHIDGGGAILDEYGEAHTLADVIVRVVAKRGGLTGAAEHQLTVNGQPWPNGWVKVVGEEQVIFSNFS